MFRKWNPKDIAFAGIYLALILIMGFTPYVGFILIPGAGAIALIMIPIMLVTIHYGWRGAILGMCTFGLVSFIAGLYMAGSHHLIIQDSLGKWFAVAWGGRMLAGLAAALIVWATHKFPLFVRMIIAIIVIELFNTIGYIGMKYLLAANNKTFWAMIATSWLNFVVEWTVVPAIVMAFYPVFRHVLKKQ